MRTVIIHLDSTFCDDGEVKLEQYFRAIGYLSWWNQTFPVLEIYPDRDAGHMIASYRKEEGGPTSYVIGAFWEKDEQKYSFYS